MRAPSTASRRHEPWDHHLRILPGRPRPLEPIFRDHLQLLPSHGRRIGTGCARRLYPGLVRRLRELNTPRPIRDRAPGVCGGPGMNIVVIRFSSLGDVCSPSPSHPAIARATGPRPRSPSYHPSTAHAGAHVRHGGQGGGVAGRHSRRSSRIGPWICSSDLRRRSNSRS
jgi:hypothetical protein